MFRRILGEKRPTRRGVKNLTLFRGVPGGQTWPQHSPNSDQFAKNVEKHFVFKRFCWAAACKLWKPAYVSGLTPAQPSSVLGMVFVKNTKKHCILHSFASISGCAAVEKHGKYVETCLLARLHSEFVRWPADREALKSGHRGVINPRGRDTAEGLGPQGLPSGIGPAALCRRPPGTMIRTFAL